MSRQSFYGMGIAAARGRRWSDNDSRFGPFTYSSDSRYRSFTAVLSSGVDEHPGCNLRLSAFGRTLIIELPAIIKPYRVKVVPGWDAATVERLGRDWYWNEDEREYGFTVSEGHLSVPLGRQTNDSSTEQRWGYFLPWTQWRFIRHSRYDLAGEHFWTDHPRARWDTPEHDENDAAKERCPSASFEFDDFDGERITAKTSIEEREWKFGEGWFKWLSLFRRSKIRRVLDIWFSRETGERKGSWKGGTVGISIEMLPGELHEAAFRRYCEQNNMTFIRQAETP
jgi:hypothetical protein